jgi:hypothetical protein
MTRLGYMLACSSLKPKPCGLEPSGRHPPGGQTAKSDLVERHHPPSLLAAGTSVR